MPTFDWAVSSSAEAPLCPVRLSDVLAGRSWADVSYDEAKELAMAARSFRPTGGDVASDATPFPEPSVGRPSERGASI